MKHERKADYNFEQKATKWHLLFTFFIVVVAFCSFVFKNARLKASENCFKKYLQIKLENYVSYNQHQLIIETTGFVILHKPKRII